MEHLWWATLFYCVIVGGTKTGIHGSKSTSNHGSDFLSLCADYTSSYSPPPSTSSALRVRVITYNVQQLPVIRDQRRRREELVKALDRFSWGRFRGLSVETPDVIVFQVIRAVPLDNLFPRPRHPIIETHGFVFSEAQGWDGLTNKGAVLAKIEIPVAANTRGAPDARQAVWVLGTHLQADEGSMMGGGIREKQAREFTAWIDNGNNNGLFKIDAEKEPIIVAGDLNVEFRARQQDYQNMLHLTKIRVNYTLEDANDTPGSLSAKDNWLAKLNYYHNKAPLDYDDVLDYVGFRRDFRRPIFAPAQKVLPVKADQSWYWWKMRGTWDLPGEPGQPRRVYEYYHNGYYRDISDHYPVVADFFF